MKSGGEKSQKNAGTTCSSTRRKRKPRLQRGGLFHPRLSGNETPFLQRKEDEKGTMGHPLRKTITIAPGIRINLSKAASAPRWARRRSHPGNRQGGASTLMWAFPDRASSYRKKASHSLARRGKEARLRRGSSFFRRGGAPEGRNAADELNSAVQEDHRHPSPDPSAHGALAYTPSNTAKPAPELPRPLSSLAAGERCWQRHSPSPTSHGASPSSPGLSGRLHLLREEEKPRSAPREWEERKKPLSGRKTNGPSASKKR